jgi:hypothetical protein
MDGQQVIKTLLPAIWEKGLLIGDISQWEGSDAG